MSDQPTENIPNTTLSALLATLVPTLIISGVYIGIFLILRRSHKRFYAPRTYLGTLREDERTDPLPDGWLDWISSFIKIPDSSALKSQSLDAYLFLRFLKITVVIMFVGTLITWPILFPVYATGGSGSGQLDMLSMSNINKSGSGKYRYYATAFVAWIFFTFVLYLVTRESIFFINIRQAFLLSPLNSHRISSRTVLFTSVPSSYRDESKLRQIFGSSVKRIWITKDSAEIDELVSERDNLLLKLESSEVNLIKIANTKRLKAKKKKAGQPGASSETAAPTTSGSIVDLWVPEKKRPTHKLGLFGLLGQKVDSIKWCRNRLETLIPAVKAAQTTYKSEEANKIGSVFIEFHLQSQAQAAFQSLSHHQALQMAPRFIGINPNEVVWSSLKLSWSQRIVRRAAVIGFISALIIFWAIPVGFVGVVSNVNYLRTYQALSWLDQVPDQIMGIITGLLPAVALGILMSLVPIIIRLLGKISGEPSLARVELFTQNAYFVFQVVQVFLVATVASAATSLIKQAINDPSSITTIMATNIPKASNFYISYFIVQGLTVASGVISQVVGFFIFSLLYKYLSGTPRSLYEKWAVLSSVSWGSVLPVLTNIAVIGITYSCIAPLILGFATIGMSLFYIAYRYNILFVTNTRIDTKGLIYPRALQHLLTGIYLAEICLIGLFSISGAIGPIIMIVLHLVLTILYHKTLNAAIDPLLISLPRTLLVKEEAAIAEAYIVEEGTAPVPEEGIAPVSEEGTAPVPEEGTAPVSEEGTAPVPQEETAPVPEEGTAPVPQEGTAPVPQEGTAPVPQEGTAPVPEEPRSEDETVAESKPGLFAKFLIPHVYTNFEYFRKIIPQSIIDPRHLYDDQAIDEAYLPPSVKSQPFLLWIPKDTIGISDEEVATINKITPITNDSAMISEENKIMWNPESSRPPIWRPNVLF